MNPWTSKVGHTKDMFFPILLNPLKRVPFDPERKTCSCQTHTQKQNPNNSLFDTLLLGFLLSSTPHLLSMCVYLFFLLFKVNLFVAITLVFTVLCIVRQPQSTMGREMSSIEQYNKANKKKVKGLFLFDPCITFVGSLCSKYGVHRSRERSGEKKRLFSITRIKCASCSRKPSKRWPSIKWTFLTSRKWTIWSRNLP